MREDTQCDERFEVSVTFDAERGYVASAPELRQPVVALSLGGLRRRIEIESEFDAIPTCGHSPRHHWD